MPKMNKLKSTNSSGSRYRARNNSTNRLSSSKQKGRKRQKEGLKRCIQPKWKAKLKSSKNCSKRLMIFLRLKKSVTKTQARSSIKIIV